VEQVSSGVSGGNNLHAPWSKDGKRGMAWYGRLTIANDFPEIMGS
jgi:hypothetical protein